MPYAVYSQVTLEDADRPVVFRYQCWTNRTVEGLVAVEGHTDADHNYLAQHREEVADLLKQEHGIENLRYCESQGNGLYTEISLENNAEGRVVSTLNTNTSLSTKELNRQGQGLIDREYQHNMEVAAHAFTEQPEYNRVKSDHGPPDL